MAANLIHVADDAHWLMPAPWVAVRRDTNQYRVVVNDARNPNPVTLSVRFNSFWTALISAKKRATILGVPVHAVGCKDVYSS